MVLPFANVTKKAFIMAENTKEKGHIEFRKEGSHKFYAPDRDILHVYSPLVKSALKEAADSCSDESYKTFKYLIDGVVSIHNKALTDDTPEEIVNGALQDMQKASPECISIFMTALMKSLFVLYIAGIRDSAENPVFSEREIMAAMKGISLLAVLPAEIRDQAKLEIQRALGVTDYAENSGMYVRVSDANDGADS